MCNYVLHHFIISYIIYTLSINLRLTEAKWCTFTFLRCHVLSSPQRHTTQTGDIIRSLELRSA